MKPEGHIRRHCKRTLPMLRESIIAALQPENIPLTVGQVRSGQVRYITRPKSEAMRVTRQKVPQSSSAASEEDLESTVPDSDLT
jgi:hypothetical protein